jgi:hypothetical protein
VQFLQTLDLNDVHGAVLRLPPVKELRYDVVLAAHRLRRHPGLGLLQNLHDRSLCKPLLHGLRLRKALTYQVG